MDEIVRIKDGTIAKLTDKLKTGRVDEEELKKIVNVGTAPKADISMPLTTDVVEFEAEDGDQMDREIVEAAEVMYEAGEIVVPAKHGPRVRVTDKTKDAVKRKIKKIEEKQGEKVSKYAQRLSDPQKLLIRVIGETGYSELDQILKKAKEEYPELKSESSLRASMHGLMVDIEEIGGSVVSTVKTSIPGSNHFCIYELSSVGRDIYAYLFAKEAAESEASMIRKAHGTIEHGYGIQRTAMLIKEMPYIKNLKAEVVYLTRDKEHTVKTGPNTAYIPDIVILINKDGKQQKRYIEYETGKCSDTDFYAKCNKIASFSKFINIVVPKNEAKEEVIRRIEKWRNEITKDGAEFPRKDQIKIRISTYLELRDSLKNGEADSKFPWLWEKTISPPKRKEG